MTEFHPILAAREPISVEVGKCYALQGTGRWVVITEIEQDTVIGTTKSPTGNNHTHLYFHKKGGVFGGQEDSLTFNRHFRYPYKEVDEEGKSLKTKARRDRKKADKAKEPKGLWEL